MKPLVLLATVSLAANAVLLAVVLFHPRAHPPAAAPATRSSATAAPRESGDIRALLDALAAGDPAAMAAAGCPPETIRSIAVGRAYLKQQDRIHAIQMKYQTNHPDWWRVVRPAGLNRTAAAQITALRQVGREFHKELRQALGDDASLLDAADPRLSFLPAATRARLQRINEDYGDLTAQVYAESGGLQLASDREELALLQKEKEQDLETLLGPELYGQYLMRTSPSAMAVAAQYGSAIQSEEQYRQIYALQKAFDDRFPTTGASPQEIRQRFDATPELQRQIAAILGPEQMQTVQRTHDYEYQTLTNLTDRLHLPAATPDSIYTLRDTYATESQQINANTALSRDERAAQLRALGERAAKELQGRLGQEGTDAYTGRSAWMQALRQGHAFSTTTKNPAGAVNFVSPTVTVMPPPAGS